MLFYFETYRCPEKTRDVMTRHGVVDKLLEAHVKRLVSATVTHIPTRPDDHVEISLRSFGSLFARWLVVRLFVCRFALAFPPC